MSLEKTPSKLIPVATSDAGMCLTWQNWQDCGIDTLVFYLETLLMKPGLEILYSHRNLRHVTGWSGKIILNACLSGQYRSGHWRIKSVYDGSLITLHETHLQQLITHLAPDDVILPEQAYPTGWFESDRPAQDGKSGMIYTEAGEINLLSKQHQQSFIPLAEDCHCPTCQQKLTRAYCHHLIEQTPLLAQRFLICHNVYYSNQNLNKR